MKNTIIDEILLDYDKEMRCRYDVVWMRDRIPVLSSALIRLQKQTRKDTIEEVRRVLWGGATKDEVQRRLDELKSSKIQQEKI